MQDLLIWTDVLTFRALDHIRKSANFSRNIQVMYRTAGEEELIYAERSGITVCRYKYNMGSKRNKSGLILLLDMHDLLVRTVKLLSEKMWAEENLADFWPNSVSHKRVRQYIELSLSDAIEKTMYLASQLKWAKDNIEDKDHMMLIPSGCWAMDLRDVLRKEGVDISIYKENNNDESVKFVFVLRKGFYLAGKGMKRLFRKKAISNSSKKDKKRTEDTGYKISVLYTRSAYENERSDLFWFERSGMHPRNVVFRHESKAYPLGKAELAYMRERGFNNVAIKKDAYDSCNGPVFSHSSFYWKTMIFSFGRMALLLARKVRTKKLFWQWKKLVELNHFVSSWEDYFSQYNIKVDIRTAYGKESIARCIAMDNVGGIAVFAQYSMYLRPHPLGGHAEHVYFSWHPEYVKALRETRSSADKLVATGYIYDAQFSKIKEEADKIKEGLNKNGAEFIIALFDERINEDLFPLEFIESFYMCFLSECLKDNKLGLIIKSKSNDVFETLKEVRTLLEKCKKTGRVEVLEDSDNIRKNKRKNNPIFPVVAAMAADLSVAMFSTPGVESALAGIKTINYDQFRKEDHFLYENGGKNRIVFDDMNAMLSSINRYRNDPETLSELGDYSDRLNRLDPYRDSKADVRMGSFIGQFLDGLNKGLTREETVKKVSDEFGSRYGTDKVVALN